MHYGDTWVSGFKYSSASSNTFLEHLHSNFFKCQNAVLQGENKHVHKGEGVKLNITLGYSLHF